MASVDRIVSVIDGCRYQRIRPCWLFSSGSSESRTTWTAVLRASRCRFRSASSSFQPFILANLAVRSLVIVLLLTCGRRPPFGGAPLQLMAGIGEDGSADRLTRPVCDAGAK